MPLFVTKIRLLFASADFREYLDDLERTKILATRGPDLETDDLDDEVEKEPWLENPIMGAEELLRFSRARQILLE
jgi:hypothetical protein